MIKRYNQQNDIRLKDLNVRNEKPLKLFLFSLLEIEKVFNYLYQVLVYFIIKNKKTDR